jgi:hypothetical protein
MTKAASAPGSERHALPACRACLVLRRVSTRSRTVVTRFSRVHAPHVCVCVYVCVQGVAPAAGADQIDRRGRANCVALGDGYGAPALSQG